jgi:hypothetical protein
MKTVDKYILFVKLANKKWFSENPAYDRQGDQGGEFRQ